MVRWRSLLAAAVAVITGVLAWGAPASAQAKDGVRLTGVAGWSGRCHSGRPILVRARIGAERLVSGTLSAELSGPPGPDYEVPVEVAGGTEEDVTLVVPSSFGCTGVTLRLREKGSITTAQLNVTDAGDTVLLGLLPGVRPAGAMPASAVARTGVAAVAGLEPELLDQPGAVGGLDSIGAAAADLDGLSPDQTRALIAWLADGGTLLVDAERPEELGWLPEAWRPAADGRVEAGRGQVRLTGRALRNGNLDGLAEPAAGGARGRGFDFDMGDGLHRPLQRQSGVRVLSMPGMLAALVLYVLLVGPGARIGLRRLGRLQLTWVVIPVAALTFSALAIAGGDLLRRGGKPTHLSVVETEVAGSRGRSFVGVPTRTKAAVSAQLPAGWLTRHDGNARDGQSTVRATPSGHRLTAPGVPGGFVVLGAEGPATMEGRLVVDEGRTTGQAIVRNELRVALDDVAVFSSGGVVPVGRIEAGATAPFRVPASGNQPLDFDSMARQVWSASGDEEAVTLTGPVHAPELATAESFAALADLNSPDANNGLMAAGWTDRLASPIALSGDRPAGTTLVIGRSQSSSPTGRYVGVSNDGVMMVRYVVPPGTAYKLDWSGAWFGPQPIPVPFGPGRSLAGGAEVLSAGSWHRVDGSGLLPKAAAEGGVIYVRVPFQGPVLPTLEPV